MRQVGLGEALGLKLAPIDAPGEGHGLEAEAADAIDVVDGEPHHVTQLVVVHALDDRGDKDNLQAGFAAVFDGGELGLHQSLAARAKIDVVAESVELQVERVQARFLGGLRELEIRRS